MTISKVDGDSYNAVSGHGTQFPIEDSDGGTGDHFETDRCDECEFLFFFKW
jgi:hypothetical protein